MTSIDQALSALSTVSDSGSGKSLISLGWMGEIRINPPRAIVRLTLPDFAQSQRDRVVNEIKTVLAEFDDINDVQIELGNAPQTSPIGESGHGDQSIALQPIQGVKKIIAISSGKGGVGKSTVAVNLACALAQKGFKTGLLDADIYGPNTPSMLGVENTTPEVLGTGNNQQIVPIESYGVGMVSMGFLIEENQPVIWRGPMLNGIIRQFLYQAQWGEKDILIVDLPPGTGDAQLSLAQSVPMTGVLIVTTPQHVSLQDSRRGLAMFRQMNVPVLGVIENMTEFIPPDQPDKRYPLFGSGGGQKLALENKVPLLAQIPMEMLSPARVSEGTPIVQSAPSSITAKVFNQLAIKILDMTNQINE